MKKPIITASSVGVTEQENNLLYVPPKLSANALFHYMDKIDYLLEIVRDQKLYPRYCIENIRYLNIDKLHSLAIPMKCFCDIPLHRATSHMKEYGEYGIGLTKEWGIRNGLQPVQYLTSESNLKNEISELFNILLENDMNNTTEGAIVEQSLKNHMVQELVFKKPYSSNPKYDSKEVCYADECEWRYVPDLTRTNFEPMHKNVDTISKNRLAQLSNGLKLCPASALSYSYRDLKYLIVKSEDDFKKLVDMIDSLSIEKYKKHKIISTISILDNSLGDF